DHGVSPRTVIQAIEGSAEYRTNQVQALYQRYLHRQADPGGLQGFVNFLAGGTVEQAAAILAASPEDFQLHGGNTTSFLSALYLDALGRTPDTAGLEGFTQGLTAGVSRQAVTSAVFGSPEFLTNLVESDYASLLGRASDSA